ncbi:MAG: chorismate synthase [bacterium]|nr:chorismate synthase [bacterium]
MTLRWMTAGESHGPALVGIISGFPAGLEIDFDFINSELARRQQGIGRSERQQIESDRAEIITGVRSGVTIGSPIAIRIENRDFENWRDIMSVESVEYIKEIAGYTFPRSGHADLAGMLKWGLNDARNVLERASGRTTAMTVAIGAIAKLYLMKFGTYISNRLIEYGPELLVVDEDKPLSNRDIGDGQEWLQNFGKLNTEQVEKITRVVENAREAGDTVGGVIQVVAAAVPPGLGSIAMPDERLDARLAFAVMGVPGIKAVEIGAGMDQTYMGGKEAHDEYAIAHDPFAKKWYSRMTNLAGGIEGGISNGEPICVKAWMKPLSTVKPPLMSIDVSSRSAVQPPGGERSDVSAVESAAVVLEAVVALELAKAHREKFGGDSMGDVERAVEGYMGWIEGVAGESVDDN